MDEKSGAEETDGHSGPPNCVVSIMPAEETERQLRREEKSDIRRKMESLDVGTGLPAGTSFRPRARSMVGRLPSDTVRPETDVSTFRRSKTIELANEWASDSELDSVDSDSMSSLSRLTPSPLLPVDDSHADRGTGEPLTDVLRDGLVQTDTQKMSNDTLHPSASPAIVVSSTSRRIPERSAHAENHYLPVPVSTCGDSSDSESKGAVSDDGLERSEDASKGMVASVSPSSGRRSPIPPRSPTSGKKVSPAWVLCWAYKPQHGVRPQLCTVKPKNLSRTHVYNTSLSFTFADKKKLAMNTHDVDV